MQENFILFRILIVVQVPFRSSLLRQLANQVRTGY